MSRDPATVDTATINRIGHRLRLAHQEMVNLGELRGIRLVEAAMDALDRSGPDLPEMLEDHAEMRRLLEAVHAGIQAGNHAQNVAATHAVWKWVEARREAAK